MPNVTWAKIPKDELALALAYWIETKYRRKIPEGARLNINVENDDWIITIEVKK